VIDGILGIDTRRYHNTYVGATPHEDIDAATDDSQTEPNRTRAVGLRRKATWKDLQHA
jgi:hypothetical protein